jgi:putative peptidoglycan lipid II flippase
VPRADSADGQLYVYAGSIVVATLIQLLLPLPWLYGLDGRIRLAIDIRDPAVRRVFAHMGPVTLGLGLINVSAVIGTIFAATLVDPTLAPNAIDKAFRIYMLPQGMFSVAVATVLFPTLSRLAARADIDGFRETISLGMRQIAFLLVPAGVASAVLAEPIVRLLYQRGEFGPDQTPVVAGALAAFSLGLVFNGLMLMLNRGFFSLQAPWTPTWAALASLAVNVALYAVFYRVGTWGIPFAISLSNVAGAALLIALLRRRIGGLSLRPTIRTLVLVTIASGVLAGVSYGVWWSLDQALGRAVWAQIVSLGAGLSAGGIAYLISCRLLGVRELEALLSLRARFRRA